MSLFQIFRRFPDHAACIEHLESVRWGDEPCCLHCGSVRVGRKADGTRVGRWNCHDCHSSFNVLHGTIFQKTKIPLQKWFLGIGLLLNAKKSISSCQLARDLELNQKSAWFMCMRVRAAMLAGLDQAALLSGIVEADETYVGGNPKNRHRKAGDAKTKPGRGTSKMPVVGVVERGGKVVAQVARRRITAAGLKAFITENIDPNGTLLVTDEYPAYRKMRQLMRENLRHAVVNHSAGRYVEGIAHTNTIEGFWALIKRAWFGTHHHYRRTFADFYLAEACASYNERDQPDRFDPFLRALVAP